MKIETKPLDDHQVKLTVEFEPEVLRAISAKSSQKNSRKRQKYLVFDLEKLPYDVIRRMFGDEAINEQAIEMMVDDKYPRSIGTSQNKTRCTWRIGENCHP